MNKGELIALINILYYEGDKTNSETKMALNQVDCEMMWGIIIAVIGYGFITFIILYAHWLEKKVGL